MEGLRGVPIGLTVNGVRRCATVAATMLLVDLLREELGLTGTKVGCDTAACGACTVLLDGAAVKSCAVLAAQADEAEVTTVEGLAGEGGLSPLQEAFHESHAVQCGFCTPGMLMSAAGLLRRCPAPCEAEVRRALEGNLCRCTGYQNVVRAVCMAAARAGGPVGGGGVE